MNCIEPPIDSDAPIIMRDFLGFVAENTDVTTQDYRLVGRFEIEKAIEICDKVSKRFSSASTLIVVYLIGYTIAIERTDANGRVISKRYMLTGARTASVSKIIYDTFDVAIGQWIENGDCEDGERCSIEMGGICKYFRWCSPIEHNMQSKPDDIVIFSNLG